MQLQKIILNFILNIELFFITFFHVKKNRVTFISLETDKLGSNFKLIYDELSMYEDVDIQLCLIHYHKNLFGQFKYLLNCLKQLYLIKTSRVIILDYNNYVVSRYKKEGTLVIQLWHAVGAIKKFGNLIERSYEANNYDYVLSTSTFWNDIYSQAFHVEKKQVLNLGIPRLDHLYEESYIQESKDYFYNKYNQFKGKKIILYAPTFRGDIYRGFQTVPFDAKMLLKELGDDYVVIYKFHPLLGNVQLDSDEYILNVNNEDTHMLLCVCDYLITDYSSIAFDYLILEKPLIFYVPDIEDYLEDRGLVVSPKDLSSDVCLNISEVRDSITKNSVVQNQLKLIKDKYFDYQDNLSTKRVVEFLLTLIERRNNR